MQRASYNSGTIYPNNIKDIKRYISVFNNKLEKREDLETLLNIKPKAVISPQFNFKECGYGINLAHRVLSNNKVRRVVVIGNSQNIYFNGISGCFYEFYETPVRAIEIDIDYLNIINKKFGLEFIQEAHFLEQSTEIQMPFIAYYQPNIKVIELIYGNNSLNKLSKIITWLLEDSLTSIVISSDLSDFKTLQETKAVDTICLSGIANKDNTILNKGCEASGLIGIKALNNSINELKMKNLILDYNTSSVIDKDGNSKVIGYTSVAYW